MIRLTLSGAAAAPDVLLNATVFRLTGAVVWDQLGHVLIARHDEGMWLHDRNHYRHLAFDGPCRLAFGLSRHPSEVSGLFDSILISGSVIRADGIPVAQYIGGSDMWRELHRQRWWMAMQIVMPDQYPDAIVDPETPFIHPSRPGQPKPEV